MFYRDSSRRDGYASRCKDCERILKRKQRENNPETFQRKDQIYYQNHRSEIMERRVMDYQNHPDKWSARQKAEYAMATGKLDRKNNCESCGRNGTEAHHPDYTRALDVIFLCKRCHQRLHAGDKIMV